MGLGIAYVTALRAKLPVLLCDRSKDQITKSLSFMDKLLEKDVSKGKISSLDAKEARARVSIVDEHIGIRGLRDVDMAIEVCLLTFPHMTFSSRRMLNLHEPLNSGCF